MVGSRSLSSIFAGPKAIASISGRKEESLEREGRQGYMQIYSAGGLSRPQRPVAHVCEKRSS